MLKELFTEGFALRLPKKEEDDQLQHTLSQSISHHDSGDQRPVVLNFHKSVQEFNKRASEDKKWPPFSAPSLDTNVQRTTYSNKSVPTNVFFPSRRQEDCQKNRENLFNNRS